MRKGLLLAYMLIVFGLIGLLSLSRSQSDRVRGYLFSWIAPILEMSTHTKELLSNYWEGTTSQEKKQMQESLEQIQIDNLRLQAEVERLQAFFQQQEQLLRQQVSLPPSSPLLLPLHQEAEKSLKRFSESLGYAFQAIPAKVIWRHFDFWGDWLWVKIGQQDACSLTGQLGLNSPVILGDALIGIIDYVGPRYSRVQLISNPRFVPSVRAVRGGIADLFTSAHIAHVLSAVTKEGLSSTALHELRAWQQKMQVPQATQYAAKGELRGRASCSKKRGKLLLQGTGFNLEFPDEEGPSQELWTAHFRKKDQAFSPLLQEGDLLITTGLDGLFPRGLKVATVTEIFSLQEGDYYYELLAEPLVDLWQDFSYIYILPPLEETGSLPLCIQSAL